VKASSLAGNTSPWISSARVDPHHALPVIEKTLEEMEAHDLLPYRSMLPDWSSTMAGHC